MNARHVKTPLTAAAALAVWSSFAAVPLEWDVETQRADPATFYEWQGGTYELKAAFRRGGKPFSFDLPDDVQPMLYWQTNGMDHLYWEVPAAAAQVPTVYGSQTVFRATWRPEFETGAKSYNCFIGVTGQIYNAAFQLRLRPSPGARPNALPLPTPIIDFARVKVLNPPWTNVLGTVNQYAPYLWQVDFDDSYTNSAAWYYDRLDGLGGCSARRSGNILERNYDWNYDEAATFVVKMSSGPGRLGSVGVASLGTNLTDRIVSSGERSALYRCIPGATLDGVNERCVAAEINVVATNGSRWESERDVRDINAIGAVRWALDHATSAEMAATSLASRVYIPASMVRLGYSAHFMIADAYETWVVEDGECRMVGTAVNTAVMTNFRVFADDDPYGTGYERYDILMRGESISNAWFRAAYRRPFSRLTEFAAPGFATHTETNKLQWYADTFVPEGAPESLTRNGKSWQTVHTSVYDLTNKVLRIAVQETDDWFVFQIPAAGGGGGGGVTPEDVRRIVDPTIENASRAATNYTDAATNAAYVAATNYTDAATNAAYVAATNAVNAIIRDYAFSLDKSKPGFNIKSFSVFIPEIQTEPQEIPFVGDRKWKFAKIKDSLDELYQIEAHLEVLPEGEEHIRFDFSGHLNLIGVPDMEIRLNCSEPWYDTPIHTFEGGVEVLVDGVVAQTADLVVTARMSGIASEHYVDEAVAGIGGGGGVDTNAVKDIIRDYVFPMDKSKVTDGYGIKAFSVYIPGAMSKPQELPWKLGTEWEFSRARATLDELYNVTAWSAGSDLVWYRFSGHMVPGGTIAERMQINLLCNGEEWYGEPARTFTNGCEVITDGVSQFYDVTVSPVYSPIASEHYVDVAVSNAGGDKLPEKLPFTAMTNENGYAVSPVADFDLNEAGTNWTLSAGNGKSIVFGNGRFIRYDGSFSWESSDDAVSWESFSPSVKISEMTFSRGKFWGTTYAAPNVLYSSDDGVSWSEVHTFDYYVSAVLKTGNGNILVGTAPNRLYYSTDGGATFTLLSSGVRASGIPKCFHETDAGLVIVGTTKDILYSENHGVTWSRSMIGTTEFSEVNVTGISENDYALSLTTENHGILSTRNGVKSGYGFFPSEGAAHTGNWSSACCSYGRIYACSADGRGIWTSADGVTWTATPVTNGTWSGIAFGNSRICAVSASGSQALSVSRHIVPFVQRIKVNGETVAPSSPGVVDISVPVDYRKITDNTFAARSYSPWEMSSDDPRAAIAVSTARNFLSSMPQPQWNEEESRWDLRITYEDYGYVGTTTSPQGKDAVSLTFSLTVEGPAAPNFAYLYTNCNVTCTRTAAAAAGDQFASTASVARKRDLLDLSLYNEVDADLSKRVYGPWCIYNVENYAEDVVTSKEIVDHFSAIEPRLVWNEDWQAYCWNVTDPSVPHNLGGIDFYADDWIEGYEDNTEIYMFLHDESWNFIIMFLYRRHLFAPGTIRLDGDRIAKISDVQKMGMATNDVERIIDSHKVPQYRWEREQSNFGIWRYNVESDRFPGNPLICEWNGTNWIGKAAASMGGFTGTITGAWSDEIHNWRMQIVVSAIPGLVTDFTGLDAKVDMSSYGFGQVHIYPSGESAITGMYENKAFASAEAKKWGDVALEHSEATRQIVYTWENFLDGSNVVFSITNYISGSYSLDEGKLKIRELKDIGGGEKEYVTVYDSRSEIVAHQTNYNATVVQPGLAAVDWKIAATSNWVESVKAPKAWGNVASDGTPAPSNTVVISAPSTVFAGGHAFERVNVGTGTVGILSSRGAAAYTGEPGTFRFRDAMTGEYFGYIKNTYTLGVHTDGISVDQANHIVTLTYNVTMSTYPVIKYLPDLDDYDPNEWEPLNDAMGEPIPGASHGISWEDPDPEPGKKVCHINCADGKGFFTAEIAGIDGNCRFETNMAAELKGGIVAHDASNTNIVFAVEPFVEDGQVKWRVKP